MVTLKQLAQWLNMGMSDAMQSNPISYTVGEGVSARTEQFQIAVESDTASFQYPTRENNTVTYYIQGLLLNTGSTVEPTQVADEFNGTISTQLQFLVPMGDYQDKDDGFSERLVDRFSQFINDFLSKNSVFSIDGYTVSTFYNFVTSGVRAVVPEVGDSFTFIVSIDFYIISRGVNSQNIVLEIDGANVPYTVFGARRVATQEQNVPSDTSDGASQALTDSTAIMLKVACPAVSTDTFYQKCLRAILYGYGAVDSLSVSISAPTGYGPNTSTLTNTFEMEFSDVSLNAEGTKNASIEATLVEKMAVL